MFWNNKTETEPTGPETSERPDWLQNEKNGGETADGKDWDTSEKVVTQDPTMDDSPTSSSGSPKEQKSAGTSGEGSSWCKRLIIVGVSVVLMALFIYSAIVQNNDNDKILWYMYYSLSAVIPAFFLCHYMICFPVKIMYAFTSGMAIWSIVMIIIISLDLADTSKDEVKANSDQTVREELTLELAGVSIGLVSALYHACASRCFVGNKNGKGEDE